MADGCQCGEQYTPDPPVVSVPVHRPPAASKDDEMSGGDGGCTATALSAVGVFSSTKEAVRALDTEITPQHEKLIKERGHCEESEAGIRGEQWHQEAVKRAVVAAGWHFQTLPINPTQAGCVDLKATLTSDSYLVVGVTNNQWWKGKTKQIRKYPDWPADAPAKDTTGWVHSIAVVDGRVRDFQTHQPISALWLEKNNQPHPHKAPSAKCGGSTGALGLDPVAKGRASRRASRSVATFIANVGSVLDAGRRTPTSLSGARHPK